MLDRGFGAMVRDTPRMKHQESYLTDCPTTIKLPPTALLRLRDSSTEERIAALKTDLTKNHIYCCISVAT